MTVALVSPKATAKIYVGLSSDSKPTSGVADGSHFLEVDTALEYVFAGSTWYQIAGSGTVLAAGSAIIGKVGIDQTTDGTTNKVRVRDAYAAAVSLTRTNDTNAYIANDVIGAATGSTAALTFPSMGPGAGEVMLTSVALEIDIAAVVSGMTSFDLYLYNVTPPSALGDNAAFDLPSGDRASFLGKFSLGTPVDLGSTLYIETNALNKQITLAGTSLFAYLVSTGAWTPAASTVFKITLHGVAL